MPLRLVYPLVLLLALTLGACGEAEDPAPLEPRATPLAVGDPAPTFPGLPPGKAVVVFYRGHW